MTVPQTKQQSVQDRYAPNLTCFGCGPGNQSGLQVKSHEEGEALVAEWTPSPHHEAFPGVLNGGIVGTLLDCHCNWTAAVHLMRERGLEQPPCTVTSEYKIRLRRPTPTDGPLRLVAHVVKVEGDRVFVEATLSVAAAPTVVCASCEGVFVAVRPGHPAYHRW